jgi:hypothetical protein
LPLLLLAGCADWPALEPSDGSGVLDPRLGVELARNSAGWRVAAIDDGDGVLVLAEERDVAWRAWRVRFPDEIEELAPPPLAIGARVTMGYGAIAVPRDDETLVFLTDAAWTALPALPPGVATGPLAHDGRVYLTLDRAIQIGDGVAWSSPLADAALGGFDATTQWAFTSTGTLRAIAIAADGSLGAAIDGPPVTVIRGSALNGDATSMQLVADNRVAVFDGASFTSGAALDAALTSAPGSHRVLARDGAADSTSTWTYVEGGVVGATALSPFVTALDGEPIDFVSMEPSPDGATMALVMVTDVDGHAVLTNRFLELPFPLDPFSP